MHHPAAPCSRRLLLSTALAAAVLATLPGCASAHRGPQLATLEVYDRDSGQLLPSHWHQGQAYVAGRPGARYALRLRNLGGARLLVVLSVDGVNVITGQTADWAQTGYVLEPGRAYDIKGWRKSDSQVAAFEFAALEQSYAARTGRPDHVGVIGLAVFREKPEAPPVAMAPPAAAPALQGANAAREKSASAEDSSAAARLGTGHGAREWSPSRRTAFERLNTTPDQLLQLGYDSLDHLVAAGIVPAPQPPQYQRPRPFPANPTAYVPDPPRW